MAAQRPVNATREPEKGRLLHVPRRFRNLPPASLVEESLKRGEGMLAASGALAVETGTFTGRSPRDKFLVREPATEGDIAWGAVNQPMTEEAFDALHERVRTHLRRDTTFRQDVAVGANPDYRYPVTVVTERAWTAQFSRNLFIETEERGREGEPILILHAPSFEADPARDGTRSETGIILHPRRRIILIFGTRYAGEVKKSVFSLLQYLLPVRGVLTMHCSANFGPEGDTAVFFGLSGTGKTTLSNDPDRYLIGDDEHGWADDGVFNLEGGCYAKTIDLDREHEPAIYDATNAFGTILENVVVDQETRRPDFTDRSLTENARSAYSLREIPNAVPTGMGGHPANVVYLTADAEGVLPPVSRLTREQAIDYFLLGYTSKLAGTERGVTEPEATFSAGFGEPFLPLPPRRYAEMLGERLDRHAPDVWLVNTGWSGGPYGEGHRIALTHTRAIVTAILAGQLARATFHTEPHLGLAIPDDCPGAPSEILDPRETWRDPERYDRAAGRLAEAFRRGLAEVDRT